MLVVIVEKSPTACRSDREITECGLVFTSLHHLAFCREGVRILDLHFEICGVEDLLKTRQEFWMRCSRTEAADPSSCQWWIDGNESVLANVEWDRSPLAVNL